MSSLLDEITKIASAGGASGSLADQIPVDTDVTQAELDTEAIRVSEAREDTPQSLTDYDTGRGFWYNFGRGIDSAASNAAAAVLAVRAAGNQMVGDDEEAEKLIDNAVRYTQGAANYGPEIRRIEDIPEEGKTWSNFARWAGGVIPNAFTYLPMVVGPGLLASGATRLIGGNILKKKVHQHARKKLKEWGLKEDDLQAVLGGNVSATLGKRSAESMQKQLAAYGVAAKKKLTRQQRAAEFAGIWAGGTVLEGGLNITDIYSETGELKPGIGMTYGTVGGLLSAPIGVYWLNQLRKAGMGNVTKGKAKTIIQDVLTKAGVSAGIEVPTEMAQEALNIAAVRHATGKSGPLNADEKSQIINAGAAALVASGTLASAGGTVTGLAKAAKGTVKKAQAAHERASLDEEIDQADELDTQGEQIDPSASAPGPAGPTGPVAPQWEEGSTVEFETEVDGEQLTLSGQVRTQVGSDGSTATYIELPKSEVLGGGYDAGNQRIYLTVNGEDTGNAKNIRLATQTRGSGASPPEEAPQIFTRNDGKPFKTEQAAKGAATRYQKNNPESDLEVVPSDDGTGFVYRTRAPQREQRDLFGDIARTAQMSSMGRSANDDAIPEQGSSEDEFTGDVESGQLSAQESAEGQSAISQGTTDYVTQQENVEVTPGEVVGRVRPGYPSKTSADPKRVSGQKFATHRAAKDALNEGKASRQAIEQDFPASRFNYEIEGDDNKGYEIVVRPVAEGQEAETSVIRNLANRMSQIFERGKASVKGRHADGKKSDELKQQVWKLEVEDANGETKTLHVDLPMLTSLGQEAMRSEGRDFEATANDPQSIYHAFAAGLGLLEEYMADAGLRNTQPRTNRIPSTDRVIFRPGGGQRITFDEARSGASESGQREIDKGTEIVSETTDAQREALQDQIEAEGRRVQPSTEVVESFDKAERVVKPKTIGKIIGTGDKRRVVPYETEEEAQTRLEEIQSEYDQRDTLVENLRVVRDTDEPSQQQLQEAASLVNWEPINSAYRASLARSNKAIEKIKKQFQAENKNLPPEEYQARYDEEVRPQIDEINGKLEDETKKKSDDAVKAKLNEIETGYWIKGDFSEPVTLDPDRILHESAPHSDIPVATPEGLGNTLNLNRIAFERSIPKLFQELIDSLPVFYKSRGKLVSNDPQEVRDRIKQLFDRAAKDASMNLFGHPSPEVVSNGKKAFKNTKEGKALEARAEAKLAEIWGQVTYLQRLLKQSSPEIQAQSDQVNKALDRVSQKTVMDAWMRGYASVKSEAHKHIISVMSENVRHALNANGKQNNLQAYELSQLGELIRLFESLDSSLFDTIELETGSKIEALLKDTFNETVFPQVRQSWSRKINNQSMVDALTSKATADKEGNVDRSKEQRPSEYLKNNTQNILVAELEGMLSAWKEIHSDISRHSNSLPYVRVDPRLTQARIWQRFDETNTGPMLDASFAGVSTRSGEKISTGPVDVSEAFDQSLQDRDPMLGGRAPAYHEVTAGAKGATRTLEDESLAAESMGEQAPVSDVELLHQAIQSANRGNKPVIGEHNQSFEAEVKAAQKREGEEAQRRAAQEQQVNPDLSLRQIAAEVLFGHRTRSLDETYRGLLDTGLGIGSRTPGGSAMFGSRRFISMKSKNATGQTQIMQGVLHTADWLSKHLGMRTPILFVDETGLRALKEVHPQIAEKLDAILKKHKHSSTTVFGETIFPSNDSHAPIIFINTKSRYFNLNSNKKGDLFLWLDDGHIEDLFALVGHELGHVVYDQVQKNMPKAIRQRLEADYRKQLNNEGIDANYTFEEWFSDQTYLYVEKFIQNSENQNAKSHFEGIPTIWRKIVQTLTKLWDKLHESLIHKTLVTRAGPLDDQMKTFLFGVASKAAARERATAAYEEVFNETGSVAKAYQAGKKLWNSERPNIKYYTEGLDRFIPAGWKHVDPAGNVEEALQALNEISRRPGLPEAVKAALSAQGLGDIETRQMQMPRRGPVEQAPTEQLTYENFFESLVDHPRYRKFIRNYSKFRRVAMSSINQRVRRLPGGNSIMDAFWERPGQKANRESTVNKRRLMVWGKWFNNKYGAITRNWTDQQKERALQDATLAQPQTEEGRALKGLLQEFGEYFKREQESIRDERIPMEMAENNTRDRSVLNLMENYWPHLYNKEALQTPEGRAAFFDLMDKYEKPHWGGRDSFDQIDITEDDVWIASTWETFKEQVYQAIINRGTTLDPSIHQDAFRWAHARQRLLRNIPTRELLQNELIETDLDATFSSYLWSAAKLLEWERAFGGYERQQVTTQDRFSPEAEPQNIEVWAWNPSKSITDWLQDLRRLDREEREAWMDRDDPTAMPPRGYYKEGRALIDVLEGKAATRGSVKGRAITDIVMAFANMIVLPFAVFASMPDLGMVLTRSDGSLSLLRNNLRDTMRAIKQGDNNDLYRMAKSYGIIAEQTIQHALIESGESVYQQVYGPLHAKSLKMQEKFFKIIGMEAWTNFNRVFAMQIGKDYVEKHILDLQETGEAFNADRLAELSIGPDLAVGYQEALDWVRGDQDFDSPIGQRMGLILHKFTDEAVMRPSSALRPAWMSHPYLRLLGHLKGYFWYMYETLMPRFGMAMQNAFTEVDPNTGQRIFRPQDGREFEMARHMLYSMLTMMPLALLGLILRDAIYYAGSEREPPDRDLIDLMLRTGLAGPGTIPIEFVKWSSTQGVGSAAIHTAGPSVSLATNFFTQDLDTALSKMVPLMSGSSAAFKDFLRHSGSDTDQTDQVMGRFATN